MHIKRIHEMIEKVTECANSQLAKGTDCVDTEEMEKVACIIKDMCEAEYYSKISKAMDDYSDEDVRYYDNYRYKTSGRFAPKGRGQYKPMYYQQEQYLPYLYDGNRDMDRNYGRMYYTESSQRGTHEGRSGRQRNRYYESKMSNNGNSASELEEYMRTLSDDLTEMISDMSADEKNMVKQKMQTLMTKI